VRSAMGSNSRDSALHNTSREIPRQGKPEAAAAKVKERQPNAGTAHGPRGRAAENFAMRYGHCCRDGRVREIPTSLQDVPA
ncbi:MAG TPA: hypothetical protein VFR83_00805, partial [Burkholderiales bacterium]|nr:hypothetical protein [Burkholderiales bacterium]